MNVADIELCRELYELSGWEDTECWWIEKRNGDIKAYTGAERSDYTYTGDNDLELPAYDLGYLLRKLPVKNNSLNFELVPRIDGSWYIGYTVSKNPTVEEANKYIHAEADTPEDATAKLAIELFNQGILTKEGGQ